MQGDLFEIQGGKIALKHSHNAQVRALGRRLIKDHTKSYDDAKNLAHKYSIQVETNAHSERAVGADCCVVAIGSPLERSFCQRVEG